MQNLPEISYQTESTRYLLFSVAYGRDTKRLVTKFFIQAMMVKDFFINSFNMFFKMKKIYHQIQHKRFRQLQYAHHLYYGHSQGITFSKIFFISNPGFTCLVTNHHRVFQLFQSNFAVQVLKTLLKVSVKKRYEILNIKKSKYLI